MNKHFSSHDSVNVLLNAIAAANKVENPSKNFNVDPVISQKMRGDVRLSSSFLQKINITTLTEKAGQVVGLKSGLTASRTKTNDNTPRKPKAAHSTSGRNYLMQKVNFDTAISYDDIDMWAAVDGVNFPTEVNNQNNISKALSMICMGFNGIEWAENTDATQNPLLQDCAVGWLHKMRTENAARVMKDVVYGPNQTMKNLDAMVFLILNEFIADEFANRDDMVVICNRRTLGDKYFTIINSAGEKATEVQASDIVASTRRVGGLQAICPPYFPEDVLLVTPLKNLSIYMQKSGHRRKVEDQPDYDRIANFESENIDYIVEEYGAIGMFDGFKHESQTQAGE